METLPIFFVKDFIGYDKEGKTCVSVVRSFAYVIFITDTHTLGERGIVVLPYFVVIVTVT